MNLFKKRLVTSILAVLAFINIPLAAALDEPIPSPNSETEVASTKIPISIFERPDCVHCKEEKAFLEKLQQERGDIEVLHYDINFQQNRDLWTQIAELEGIPKVTPITLVGNTLIQGFGTEETTGQRIIDLVEKSKGKETINFEQYLAQGGSGNVEKVINGTCDSEGLEPCADSAEQDLLVNVPFVGALNLKEYSLPALSLVLGFIDGFNPCAMWVLVTFLVILIDAGSRKKMWQLAGIFIVAEAVMYYLILNVWFTAWDFIGLNSIVTPLVGLVAVGAGLFFLYEWKTSDGTCKVTNAKSRAKTRSKIQKIVDMELTFLSIFAILGIALSVNIIEFACSVGIPQTFTKVLDINNLSFWMQQFYMALYILMYMVDDIIVFGIALYSFERIGITTKYTKISHLIGGALMLILGLILVLKPELLIF